MINALSSALAGLNRARDELNSSAQRISKGDTEIGALVDAKVAAFDVRVQSKNLSLMMEQEEEVLDILA